VTLAGVDAPTIAGPDRPSARARVWVAVGLVLVYAGASTLHWLDQAADWPSRRGQDEISAYQRRMEALRPVLPARGMVGYLGDPAPTGAGALQHFRRYLLAQYSLAPLLVLEDTEPEFVVGNFYPGTTPTPPPGFRVVRDFGDGLILFQRSTP
jgi:hypothetical protein